MNLLAPEEIMKFVQLCTMLALTISDSVFSQESGPHLRSGIPVFDGKLMDLLGGSSEEIEKLKDFPFEKYAVYNVPTLGSFYVDYLQDTIKATLASGNVWEPNIVELIKMHAIEGSVAIDLGSHIGTHLVSMSLAVGEHGVVYGFEPQKKLFSELVKNMEINKCSNVIAYRCAVGREFGEVQMSHSWETNEGGTPIGLGGDKAYLIPLDSLELENVSLIKMDVEGYEDEAIAGAEQTIRRCRPFIIIELMDQNEENIRKRDATMQNLESMGYTFTKLWGWDWYASPTQRSTNEMPSSGGEVSFL